MASSIQTQFLDLTAHHKSYAAIDPRTTLKGSAAGKVLFLTGASQGIGRATAVAFAQAGAKAIMLTARSASNLEETQAAVRAANPATACSYRICDVTDETQVRAAVDACVTEHGGIDVADANAGYLANWRKIGESDPSSWWRTWEVNVRGTYHVVRYTLAHLIASARKHADRAASGGHMILLSSIGAQYVAPTASDYQTSKHAINRLCEFIDVDHSDEGVKCFAVHPGGVPTALGKNMPESRQAALIDEPELAAGFIVWLSSGHADWAKGRYLSSNWDVTELSQLKSKIVADDLLVNRLRTQAP
jgi:NAD(P)-dependent dehydrogenase (short-subunit alcohol dehydrogenase family)